MPKSLTEKVNGCATLASLDELQEGAIYAIRIGARPALTRDEREAFARRRAELQRR